MSSPGDQNGSHADHGLTAQQAADRLSTDGPNELPAHRPRTLWVLGLDVLREPMFLLLLAAAGVYLALGDRYEALVLLGSVSIIIAITLLQERRTEHALARLRDLSSPRALVIRDGRRERIAGRDVVVGDIIVLHEGDRVPADGHLVRASGLAVDESILTGESLAVEKSAANAASLHSGSLVVRGFGVMGVTATGGNTQIGLIGRTLADLSPEGTPLFLEIRRLVRWLAVAGVVLCIAIALLYAISRGDWLQGILAGITVAMGVLPEEFPVVLTVFLALGAWRISRGGVLTRRMPAVETIGSVTVLAVDKTGTLTQNRMEVVALAAPGGAQDLRFVAHEPLSPANAAILEVALSASKQDAFDPMERAIIDAARHFTPQAIERARTATLAREFEMVPGFPVVTHVWQISPDTDLFVAAKGAPETILRLCKLEETARQQHSEQAREYASQGLRLLGVARAYTRDLQDDPSAFPFEFLGFLCLADPIRPDVPAALKECQSAGIRVVMITGDHPGTAVAIALQSGFDVSAGACTGSELERLSDADLADRVRTTDIYARMSPQHKMRLITQLKANREIVAMTGDGVNDAPALKTAHVGVAMGARGTDVAREAADLVLVNDDFASLVGAVRLGRRIYENIRHATGYLLAVHVPIAGMGLLPVLLDWPLFFFPVHILFLEFIIDPACSFVFEADAGADDLMKRPPRRPDAPLFTLRRLRTNLLLGCVALVLVAAVYGVAYQYLPVEEARAVGFVTLVSSNLLLIFVSRRSTNSLTAILKRPNLIFWGIAGAALLALAIVLTVPIVADLFSFDLPAPAALAMAIMASAGILLASLVVKDHSSDESNPYRSDRR